MADAYLVGGPCDGTTHTITAAEADQGEIVCKGGLYKNPYTGQHHNGDLVFKYAGKANTTGGAIKAAKAHHGWADVRKSVNHHMPAALRKSQHNTQAALRSLHRGRKVRG